MPSFVISCFAIVILSILGLAFKNGHEEFVGGIEDPADGPAVASTIFVAVLVYVVSGGRSPRGPVSTAVLGLTSLSFPQGFLVFCGLQGLLHMRESRRGAIAL